MTPKEVVAKGYECFNTGDMETFVTLFHADVVVTINGMHIFSGVHEGIDAWMRVLAKVPANYYRLKTTVMIPFSSQIN